MGPNEVQLPDLANQFFQINVQNTMKKGRSAILTETQLRFNSSFVEFFKYNTSSNSAICKKNLITLILISFRVFHLTPN